MSRNYKNLIFAALIAIVCLGSQASAQTISAPAQGTTTAALKAEVRDFMAREMAAHFGNIKSLDPPPDRVFNALTVGEFSWGSFMRALAAQADLGGSREIAGKDTAKWIGQMGLIEQREGGKAFAQMYAAMALRHYGEDLNRNAVWQTLSESERKEWEKLLDATRIYDPVKREVINLPENYLGVAAKIAALSFKYGILKDRQFLDSLVERAAKQFLDGKIYADDNMPTSRYDRYSNEYARFCWEAAEWSGRKDIQEKLKPSLKEQMRLWWDIVNDRGYGYNWGRSQGLVSYLDTVEIAAFLGQHPEFRPAPLADIAAVYNLGWRWLRKDYSDETHMFTVFAFGRGNYGYINPLREWQQTGTAFGKIAVAHDFFIKALEKEGVSAIPAAPQLKSVARFQFFAKDGELKTGVWVVRQGNLRFALPITVGTKPAIADYLAAPFGLAGFSAPVEEVYPSLTPFLEMENGKTIAASDGAEEIEPSADGQSLRVVWKKWAQVGNKSGDKVDPGITAEVRWRIAGDKLIREETITTAKDVKIKRWRVAVTTTGDKTQMLENGKIRKDVFTGREGTLETAASFDWPVTVSLLATGDGKLGKGVLGAIPLHLIFTAENLELKANQPRKWMLEMTVAKVK